MLAAESALDLAALLAKAERTIAARDKTIQALVTREQNRAARRLSSFGIMEENAALQQIVTRKTLEVETQNRQLEQTTNELRETSTLLEVLLENTPVHIYFKDEASRFVRFSKSLQTDLHIAEASALTGHTDADFFAESYARQSFLDEQAILASGQPMVGKTENVQHADGRTFWSLTTKMPWRDKSQRIIGTVGISSDLTAIKTAEAELRQAHEQLVETSRLAGMAEVATSVLHNVGNVLNSVNVSVTLVTENLKKSKLTSLGRVVALLNQHASHLGDFVTTSAQGKSLPGYLLQLHERLADEQQSIVAEVESLRRNVDHIKQIVSVQQDYARISGVTEMVSLEGLIEDALRMVEPAWAAHQIGIVREFATVPALKTEKHKVLQILVNLVRNAKQACKASDRMDRLLTVRLSQVGDSVRAAISDNGVGISSENLARVFNHGFTTKKDGHGFGLHSGALAAKEMGGALRVESQGVGEGATFTLELPLKPSEQAKANRA